MNNKLPLSNEKKITVLIRLEAGCLGSEGETHIDEFCQMAQPKFESIHSDFVSWSIVPRHDKSLPEIQYLICNKNLTQAQASKFFNLFQVSLYEFEEHLHNKLALIIEQYFDR